MPFFPLATPLCELVSLEFLEAIIEFTNPNILRRQNERTTTERAHFAKRILQVLHDILLTKVILSSRSLNVIYVIKVSSHLGDVNSTDRGMAQGNTCLESNFIVGSTSSGFSTLS